MQQKLTIYIATYLSVATTIDLKFVVIIRSTILIQLLLVMIM